MSNWDKVPIHLHRSVYKAARGNRDTSLNMQNSFKASENTQRIHLSSFTEVKDKFSM